ncbi:MAG: YaeQ family protein [Deltaproteobacteria bacterium]|nr:YaeQ family protein [Deltaproteobacteria bacterium]
MALTATVHNFDVALSDVDRGLYESLALKVARHPSESAEYLVARVLAYALELEEGLAFSGGLSNADEPALWVHDLTGQLRAWIEVGTPDAARLHRASKACGRVRVYCHKEPSAWLRQLQGQKVHAPERVEVVILDRTFIAALAARLEKRTGWSVSVNEGELYVDLAGESLHAVPERRTLDSITRS